MNLKVFNNFTIYVKNFISKTSKQNLQIWNDAYHNWSRVETTSALKTPIGGISEIKGINLVPPDLRLQCAVQQQDGERHPPHQGWQETRQNTHKTLLAAGLTGMLSFNLFGRKEEGEDDPKDKLIMTIKRSILCIQREQYDKAEQMLHLALRMAQDLQSKEGVTYIFDVMANLAMEREQFKKAEKLFADVMQRLFADGHNEESPQVLHISSKLAHMAQLQGDLEKAYSGFTWTLERIGKSIKNVPEDKELLELYGLTKNWFGQLLMKQFKYNDAKKYFEEAYACLTDIYGPVNEAAVTILNNLSVACVNLEDFTGAKEYLSKAIDIVKELKDTAQEGILHANMGLIYLREGLMSQAKEECAYAYRIGKKHKNDNAVEQAEYCLNEVRGSL